MTAQVDTSLLHQRIGDWAKIVGVTSNDALLYHGGMLKWEMAEGSPPKNKEKAQKKAVKDTKKVFFSGKEGGPGLKPFFGPKADGKAMRWIYAGPQYVVGVQPDDWQPGMNGEQMQREMNESRRGFFRGAGWHEVGKRGPQHIFRLNRTVVTRGRLAEFRKRLLNQFGKLKAAWFVGMDMFPIATSKRIPAWVRKHIPDAKGYNNIQLNGPAPFVEIVNFSPGVSHERALANVRRAVKKRAGAIKKDLSLYLQGIKKAADFKMPSLFKPTALWLLIAPLGISLDTHGILASPALITDGGRITQHQAFTHRAAYGKEHFAQVEEIFDDSTLDRTGNPIAGEHGICPRYPPLPSAFNIRRIEHHKSNLWRPLAVLSGQSGSGEVIPSSPQFAIKPDALRQLPGESAWGFDAAAVPSPEGFAIPERTAAIQLLAEMPARQIGLSVPILQQRHVSLVHADSLPPGSGAGYWKPGGVL